MVNAVDNLIDFVTNKFTTVTEEIFAKRRFCWLINVHISLTSLQVDEMGQRLDELEASIRAGADNHDGNE